MAVDPPLPPPDRPTEPLVPVRPVARERVVAGPAAADPLLIDDLRAAVQSLRTALALIGALAVVALAVGIYALVDARQNRGDGRGASRARVARLDDRVTRLSRQVQSTRAGAGSSASASDVQALRQQLRTKADTTELQSLRSAVSQLRASSGQQGSSPSDAAATQKALDDLGKRIDDLDQQVQQLKQQSPGTP